MEQQELITPEMVKELRYVLLPGKCAPDFVRPDLYDGAYRLWKDFWKKIYDDAGSPASFVPDDFLRQDVVCGLFYKDRPVALHLYTLFNVKDEAVRDHRYFAFYPPEFVTHLQEQSAPYVMSMEFLTVDPAWRKKATGVSLAEILIACGIEAMKSLGADAAVAPARRDVGVHEMARKVGFEAWQKNVVKRNFVCDLIIAFQDRVHPHEDPVVREHAARFWTRRLNLVPSSLLNPAPIYSETTSKGVLV